MSETRRRRVARYHAAGLNRYGKTPGVGKPFRDHAAEVEAGLALGLDLDGIASDMGVKPDTLVTMLRRKGHLDLVRRLGVLSISDTIRAR